MQRKEIKNVTINPELQSKSLLGKQVTLKLTNSTYGSTQSGPYPFWHMEDHTVYVVEEYPRFYVIEVPGFIGESTLGMYKDAFAGYDSVFDVGGFHYKYEARLQTIDKWELGKLFKVKSVVATTKEKFVATQKEVFKNKQLKRFNKEV